MIDVCRSGNFVKQSRSGKSIYQMLFMACPWIEAVLAYPCIPLPQKAVLAHPSSKAVLAYPCKTLPLTLWELCGNYAATMRCKVSKDGIASCMFMEAFTVALFSDTGLGPEIPGKLHCCAHH